GNEMRHFHLAGIRVASFETEGGPPTTGNTVSGNLVRDSDLDGVIVEAAATRPTPTGIARSARMWPATSAMTSWVAPGFARRDLHRDGSVAQGFVAAASGLPSLSSRRRRFDPGAPGNSGRVTPARPPVVSNGEWTAALMAMSERERTAAAAMH